MSNELAVLENLNAVEVFVAGGTDKLLQAIRDEVINDIPDTTTVKGRTEIASRAYKVAKSSVAIDKLGKELADKLNAQLKPINTERKKSKDTLAALKNEVREPLTIWEDAEKERVEKLKARLAILDFSIDVFESLSIESVKATLDSAKITPIDDTWQEFKGDAEIAKPIFIERLTDHLNELKVKESDRLKLVQLQKEEAERKQKEREAQIAKDAAAEAEARAAAAIAREEEAKKQAARDVEAAKARENQAAIKAEYDKKQAVINAGIAKDIAIEKERKRITDEQEAIEKAAEKKAANKEHRKIINLSAMEGFNKKGIDEEMAKKIITAIAKGQIPFITINY